MEATPVHDAIRALEKANANLDPDLLSADGARDLLTAYARAEKLAAFGKTVLARRLADATEVARVTGTSIGKAKATVDTGTALAAADDTRAAFQAGTISLDQATEIARAEQASPGAGSELVAVATTESFHVLRDRARTIVLESDQGDGLADRQHAARFARSHRDELGMVHIHVALEPHVGTPLVTRAEATATRLARAAKHAGRPEPFERHLADAYGGIVGSTTPTRSRRPELVVLVSHEVATRGWRDVRPGEVCKIPGVGTVSPATAKKIAADAFLTGIFYNGTDLRHLRRWTRNPPIEVLVALELGTPPEFDGVKCADCGNRFRTENDHVHPHVAGGPASTTNLEPRCWSCHQAKTERDRRAGKLTRRAPGARQGPLRR